jgi:scyllo-inositol 2-dehydrogenase (NADP+)
VTSVRVLTDDTSAPLYRAIIGAPLMSAAGISLVDHSPDVEIMCCVHGSGTSGLISSGNYPVLRVGEPDPTESWPVSQPHEIRLRAKPLGEKEDVLIFDRVMSLPPSEGTPLITANIGFTDICVASVRDDVRLAMLGVGLEPETWRQADFLRLIHRLLHRLVDVPTKPAKRVGLLGYGAIGHEHAKAIADTSGLSLSTVCDTSQARLDEARSYTAGVATTLVSEELVESDDVDVVVVSTPPVTHAEWAIRLLESGKHVVLEKPMALTSKECDQVIGVAKDKGLLAVVYQNRRFDPDFRALQNLIHAGDLGDVFHLEAFVGRFAHPCNYWHSDAQISGGALFDWGSHVIDQILQLMPGEIGSVSARNQKLLWHDVTNADHARMTLHYSDGREASFIYSDISAALKPRWYVAGTRGGVVGTWRHERVVSRSAIGTLHEDVLDPADSPPILTLYSADGRITTVPGAPAPPAAFHTELADYLLNGLPMSVKADESRRVVSLLEAAEISALDNGLPVKVS